ncbi:MAG: hypothetical protein IJW86_04805 [Clostridia bacterium]|nr:hypothetical protein [Clostridia bacterium]
MKTLKKSLAVLLAFIMAFSCSVLPASAEFSTADSDSCDCGICPSIIIPGLFQSKVRYLDENGNEMLNSEGQPYAAPFFMEATSDVVKLALSDALLPLGSLLITQEDKENRCAEAIAGVLGEALLGNIAMDEKGNPIKNIRADRYTTSLANLTAEERNYALNQIPLHAFSETAGLDHLFFFSYLSTGNIMEIANELFELIQIAKKETGHAKVNLAPISQGGSICNALVQLYLDKGLDISDDINRICYVIPAADGSNVIGDIYHYGLLDDPDALYGYMFPSLLGDSQEYLAYLINIILRIFPEADFDNILDTAVQILVEDYLERSTCLWALIPSAHYPECREMYLMDEDDTYIRAQTDWYYDAQVNSRKNILDMIDKGIECFDIVNYNVPLYSICDSWDDVNADGIIHMDSESFGATSINVNTPLPEDYKQANTYCTDPSHNHIDKDRIVDASTGILCETTFYFKDQNHEQTASNDVIMRLAVRILTDDSFKGVYSDPGFPQFNFARKSRTVISHYNLWKDYDTSSLSAADAAEFIAARDVLGAAIDSTCMPTEEFNAAAERFEAAVDKIIDSGKDEAELDQEKEEAEKEAQTNFLLKILSAILGFFSNLLLKLFGNKGFSDILK